MTFKNLHIICFAIIILIINSCGQRGMPSGGARDTTSPKILQATPKNSSTNFKGKTIELKFDEYVQLRSIAKEFIISPPVKKKPEFKIKGKKVIIEFDTLFNPKTTYNVYFGNGIVDYNEGNVLDSNHFVFSTGDFIDSLTFSGKIYDAFSREPETDMLVGLYNKTSDSTPIKNIPTYFTKVKDGNFNFLNLAAGDYLLFALQDANSNYLYDLANEKIAFYNELVTVSPNQTNDSIVLLSFTPNSTKQYVKKVESPYQNKLTVSFNIATKNPEFKVIDQDTWKMENIKWNLKKDSAIIYYSGISDSLKKMSLIVSDSNYIDTIKVQLSPKKIPAPQPNFNSLVGNNSFDEKSILYNYPIQILDSSKIYLLEDSVQKNNIDFALNEYNDELTINYRWKEEKTYHIIILPGFHQTLIQQYSDTLIFKLPIAKNKSTASLTLTYDYQPEKEPIIIQLMQGKKVIESIYLSDTKGVTTWNNLTVGKYQLRLIVDTDNNKIWSPGDYQKKKMPEKIYYLKEEMDLRANWNMDIKWEIVY